MNKSEILFILSKNWGRQKKSFSTTKIQTNSDKLVFKWHLLYYCSSSLHENLFLVITQKYLHCPSIDLCPTSVPTVNSTDNAAHHNNGMTHEDEEGVITSPHLSTFSSFLQKMNNCTMSTIRGVIRTMACMAATMASSH